MIGVRDSRNPLDCSALSHSDNKRVSGYASLRPNPAFGWTSYTRQPLGDMAVKIMKVRV